MIFYDNLEQVMEHFTKTGAFLTVKNGDAVNTMVVSWGFIGFLWGKPQFVTVVRPQRYTHELLERADDFTISVPFGALGEELKVCGTKSGRDVNKSEIVSFVPSKLVNSPVVDGCDMYYECVLRYADAMKEAALPSFVRDKFYNNDYHTVFIGEIMDCYSK